MNKVRIYVLFAAIIALLCGCGNSLPEENTITIDKNFSIEAAYVSDFDENTYNSYLLEKEISDLVSEYNSKAESKNIKLKKVEVVDNTAYVRMKFNDCVDYQRFNDEVMYAGLLSDAMTYSDLDKDINVLTLDGKVATTPSLLASDENNSDYKLCVIQGDNIVEVKGTPVYVSEDVTVDGETGEIRVTDDDPAYIVYE